MNRCAIGIAEAAALAVAGAAHAKPLEVQQKLATYRAEIRRTPYGIPHVKADDFGVAYFSELRGGIGAR